MAQVTRSKGEHERRGRGSAGLDPEQEIEIARIADQSARTAHQFETNKARAAQPSDDDAGADESEEPASSEP